MPGAQKEQQQGAKEEQRYEPPGRNQEEEAREGELKGRVVGSGKRRGLVWSERAREQAEEAEVEAIISVSQ